MSTTVPPWSLDDFVGLQVGEEYYYHAFGEFQPDLPLGFAAEPTSQSSTAKKAWIWDG